MAVRARAAATATPTRIGGRYEVVDKLGRGGMGAVFRVRDGATGKELALKQVAFGPGTDPAAARLRFRREFHTMASLRHPRIVEVFDYGVDAGVPYYTMELLDGKDLHDLDKVPWQRACALLRDVATALAFLHVRRLLHRDLAPRNVRCTADGRAKLIDFGVLATTGVTGDVAGTPPFIAPEALHGRPLDHRYDLFGLGALAYRILTGKHAYPARALDELEALWRKRPAPPSQLVAGIPPALDELVMAMLAHDPLARPVGAAEVIDQLTAIGELERQAEVQSQHGWIASAALVGRRREMAQIRRAVSRAHDGDGRSIVIEAPSGTGKTRLLRELAIEAQLAGLSVVRADSDAAGRGPYGVVHELARGLIAAAPDDALAAARPRAAMLARVIASLRDRLGVKPAPPRGDPAEDRMALQTELAAWLLEVAARRSIALLVDDVQRCDEASAAVLAALAHQAADKKLVVGVALRTDEEVRAPAAIAALCDAGQRLRLRGLDPPQLAELCRSLFGDVPHVQRLAQWMHDVGGGSPLHATELARHLVDRNVIRYVEGLWVIPEDPAREDLPRGLTEAMDARVRALPAPARALGEVLSVHGGELTLALIVELAEVGDAEQVFAALDQLAFDEVLIAGGEQWRFRHDGLREALLRGLGEDRRRVLHLRVGKALAAMTRATHAERDAEIGWHLLRGGDLAGGAARLERAGRALYAAQSFSDCIAPLEAALDVREGERASARVRLELLHTLVMAGAMADRKTALRHADACIAGYRRWAGIDVAQRLSPRIGKHLAVIFGLWWALLRWLFTPRRGPNPIEAFRTFFIVVGYAATVHSLAFDSERVQTLVDELTPIAIMKNRIPYAVYLLVCNLYHFPRGDFAIAERNSRRILEILERDHLTPIRDIDRRTGGGGALYMLVVIAVINLDPKLPDELAALARLQLRFFDIGAEQARVALHRLRGEEEAAVELEARVELMFVQLGSLWQMEAFVTVVAVFAYGITRDTLGLRRVIEQLAVQCAKGLRYEPFLALARGEYLRERGDVEAALAALEPQCRPDDTALLQTAVLPAFAETLLLAGNLERAKEVAERGRTLSSNPATFTLHGLTRAIRVLALVEASLGDHEGAARRLERALEDVASHDSPALTGSLHEARARVALAAGDSLGFYQHLADTEREFRRTRNPVLIARAERLARSSPERAPRAPTAADEPATVASPRPQMKSDISVVSVDAVTTPPAATVENVSAVFSGCRGSGERAARALEMLIGASSAASGYLYLRRAGELALVAPTFGDEPTAAVVRAVRAGVEHGGDVTRVDVPRRESDGFEAIGQLEVVPLVLHLEGAAPRVVGAVAVLAGALPLARPAPDLVDKIAHELYDAGDVTQTREGA